MMQCQAKNLIHAEIRVADGSDGGCVVQLDEFISRLDGVRENGDGHMALCPGHDDRNPSLSVASRDGKILIHCFAGCTVESVVHAMGLSMSALFSNCQTRRLP